MAKGHEEIQAFHAARKMNILKGFKEVSEVPPVPLKELQEQVGKENIYTYEVLKGFTQEVLEKGEESERLKAKQQISNLTPLSVIDERGLRQVVYVEKGHMDFDSSGGGRQGLVKKQITDKTGKQTSRWVRQGEEDKEEKQPKGEEETSEDENPDGTKPTSEFAKETPTEELKRYLEENPDGEHATHAKRELQVRGESEGGDGTEGVDGEESTAELDFNNSEAVKQYLAENPETKEKMMAIIEEDLFITPISALKQAMKGDKDQSETHAAIDEAQASLDSLKEKVGHPSSSEEDEGLPDDEDPAYRLEMYTLALDEQGAYEATTADFVEAILDIDVFDEDSENNAAQGFKKITESMSKEEFLSIVENETSDPNSIAGMSDMWDANVEDDDSGEQEGSKGANNPREGEEEDSDAAKEARGESSEKTDTVNDGNDEGGDSDDQNTTLDEANTDFDEVIMNDMEDALYEEFGDTQNSTHIADIENILDKYDVMSDDSESPNGLMDTTTPEKKADAAKRIAEIMERNGWTIQYEG